MRGQPALHGLHGQPAYDGQPNDAAHAAAHASYAIAASANEASDDAAASANDAAYAILPSAHGANDATHDASYATPSAHGANDAAYGIAASANGAHEAASAVLTASPCSPTNLWWEGTTEGATTTQKGPQPPQYPPPSQVTPAEKDAEPEPEEEEIVEVLESPEPARHTMSHRGMKRGAEGEVIPLMKPASKNMPKPPASAPRPKTKAVDKKDSAEKKEKLEKEDGYHGYDKKYEDYNKSGYDKHGKDTRSTNRCWGHRKTSEVQEEWNAESWNDSGDSWGGWTSSGYNGDSSFPAW